MRGLLRHWTKSSIIPISKEESVWRNKKPRSRTVSFEADRLPTWSTIFRVTGTHDSVENYTDLFTIVLRNDDIQEFDSMWDGILMIDDENLTSWHLGRIVQIKNTRVWKTQDRIWNCTTCRFTRRKLDLINTDWRQWWREVSSRKFEKRILGTETEITEERRGQESRNTTACTKNFWKMLAMGNQRAVCERRQLQFPPRYE